VKDIHGSVRVVIHMPVGEEGGDGERLMDGELNFVLPLTREQFPIVTHITVTAASVMTAIVSALVEEGILDAMTDDQKLHAAGSWLDDRARQRARDRSN
jgi:hypothetical protein